MNKPQPRLPLDDFAAPEAGSEPWRPIHYLGSKLRIVDPIKSALDALDPGRGPVCDLFAGSGTVSAALAGSRDVISVDIQEYSRVICSAILRPPVLSGLVVRNFLKQAFGCGHEERIEAIAPLIDYEQRCLREAKLGKEFAVCELLENASSLAFEINPQPVSDALKRAHKQTIKRMAALNGGARREILTFRHFGGLYFSYLQAIQLDSLLTTAHRQTDENRDCFLAAIVSTASEIVNTVGKHFAQPIRPRGGDGSPKRHLIGKIIRDRELAVEPIFTAWLERYMSIPRTNRNHRVIRGDFAEALSTLNDVGVVYADPPYTRDHYSRFYHVLETMCLWDEPAVSTTSIRSDTAVPSRGMYRLDRHQSPFCIKSQAPCAFESLFARVRDLKAPMVLSYSPYASGGEAHPRVLTVEQVSGLAKKYFSRVDVISAGRISHMKLNSTRHNFDQSFDAERLFLCS